MSHHPSVIVYYVKERDVWFWYYNYPGPTGSQDRGPFKIEALAWKNAHFQHD
jgi:hypothetical protein